MKMDWGWESGGTFQSKGRRGEGKVAGRSPGSGWPICLTWF